MSTGAAISILTVVFASMAAWITHVAWIITALAAPAGATWGQIALGAIGAFMPPVGVIHGFMIWFGYGF